MTLLTRKDVMREGGLSWQGFRRLVRNGRRLYRPDDLPWRRSS
jgi:hypothetical protein